MRKPTKKTTTKTPVKKSAAKKSAIAPNRKTTAIGPRKTRAVTKVVKKVAPAKKRAVAPPKKAASPAPRKIGKSPDFAAPFKGSRARDQRAVDGNDMYKLTAPAAEPRRGGRPRKQPSLPFSTTLADIDTSATETSAPVKRRGRPRKAGSEFTSRVLAAGLDALTANAPAKRGRGRPRKIPIVETVGSDTLTSSLASLPDSVSTSPRKTGNSRKIAPRI